jgi:hypothetical protein
MANRLRDVCTGRKANRSGKPAVAVRLEVAKKTVVAVPIADGEFFRPTAAIYKKGSSGIFWGENIG